MPIRGFWWALIPVLVVLAGCSPPQPERERAGPIELRVGFSSAVDFADVPSLMAHDLLAEQGYEIEPTFFGQPELAVEALARGDVDIGSGSTRQYWAAVEKGANIATIMEQTANEWQIVAVPGIETCADLHGRRLAQHSEGAAGKAMSDAYIAEHCPGTEPLLLYIPGSENRAAALLAGEIDATPLALADVLQLEQDAPGRFHTLTNFALDLPRLKTIGVYANRDLAAEHPEAVQDYIQALLTVHRRINEDPNLIEQAAARYVDLDPNVLSQVADASLAINAWDVNGGMTESDLEYTLDFYARAGNLEPDLTVADVADLSFLEEVLAEMGRE